MIGDVVTLCGTVERLILSSSCLAYRTGSADAIAPSEVSDNNLKNLINK